MSIKGIVGEIAAFLSNEVLYIGKQFGRGDKTLLFVLFFLSLILLIIGLYQARRIKAAAGQQKIMRIMLEKLDFSQEIEYLAKEILDIVRTIVAADGYYFYLLDSASNHYILKAVRHSQVLEENIAPSYSGLLPFKKEEYLPQLSFPATAQAANTAIIREGKVALLLVPVKSGLAQIRIGPVRTKKIRKREELDYLGEMLGPLLSILLETDKLKAQHEVKKAAVKAVKNVTNITTDMDGILAMSMDLSVKTVHANGGALIHNNQGKFAVIKCSGLDPAGEEKFRSDSQCHYLFNRSLEEKEFCALSKHEKEFYELPSYFTANGIAMVILVSVPAGSGRSIAAYWYKTEPQIEVHCLTGLQMTAKRMGELLDYRQRQEEMSAAYTDMMRMLVQNLDNLEPYTIGYSELMARFAQIIAREMQVENREIKDMVLAAQLSNIGILGFTNELLLKEGKYSDEEYELMKLHAEVGASIIEATIANYQAALYVRHHHERIDGNGYPDGLGGAAIPLGSRIIAVVQTFLAKIQGRQYRDPLPFESALELLRTASGTQLDGDVVNALIGWFEKKQSNTFRKGRSLGPCWEMRCSPVSICRRCPAYKNMDTNCWEIEGTLCKAHGNSCRTCFIYTEYLYRTGTIINGIKNPRGNYR